MQYPTNARARWFCAIFARGTLAGLLLLASGASTSAQELCFEPRVTALDVNGVVAIVTADIDGDQDLDLVLGRSTVDQVFVSRNQGSGTFAPLELVYSSPDTLHPSTLIAADFDGDSDVDIVVFRAGNPGGGGITFGALALLRNDGTGSFTTVPLPQGFTDPSRISSADFDGDAHPDLLVTTITGQQTVRILLNDGTGAFTSSDSTLPANGSPVAAALGDIDGDGDVDIASLGSGALYILSNDGSGQFSILQTYPTSYPGALTDLDGDGDLDLVSTDYAPGQLLTVRLNAGNGALSAAAIIHDYGTPSTFVSPDDIAVGDVDLDGDVDLVLPWGATAWGFPAQLSILRNAGNATFQASTNLAPVGSSSLRGARIGDMDGDGDVDLLVLESSTPGRVRLHRACSSAGEPICLGDGTGAACPCANHSAPSAQAGCLNSFGSAGTLRGAGMARLANDTLVLNGTGMTNAAVLYFQGTSARNGGLGSAFGDGLRCASGTVIRLGLRTNAGGASAFPGPASASISVLGSVVTPGERIYQAWYRNTASFCAPEGFNLTNGLRVLWMP